MKPWRKWEASGATALTLAAISIILFSWQAFAADVNAGKHPINIDQSIYEKSFTALTMLFVLAILIENALTVIFNWRFYLTFCSSRAWKTLVMIGVSYLAVKGLDADVVASLVGAYQTPPNKIESGPMTVLLTTLILAGGSSGVNTVMVALGYRDPKKIEAKIQKPAPDKAWVAFRVTRDRVQGPVTVSIDQVAGAVPPPPSAIAGTINNLSTGKRMKEVFFPYPHRFPRSGGYVVEPGKVYAIAVTGTDGNNQPVAGSINGQYAFAAGAIVDLEVTL